jgi:hypothetical protein
MERFTGEPNLDEILSDPIIRSVMKADGIDMRRLCEILVKAAGASRLTTPALASSQETGFGLGYRPAS